ncbi:DUF952 domain-containing protein [Streptomyces sp. SID3343]|uniref:DUF952 domain-containing protein n=1 Tax=Streptomyces sp. SID3343 TaxID=2690260 RepID=UPI0013715C52|nr:DUF952 domain-containing protein [Streptomyces sp. SID3343]MYV98310.1 DUF952 domain-containing protein [Streptomyces sp. SID3343]
MSADVIYKLLDAREWADFVERGVFEGAGVDLADGYVHFSTREQVVETARRHFAGRGALFALTVDAPGLREALRWEPSRGGDLFPHLYGALDRALVLSSISIDVPADADGDRVAEAVRQGLGIDPRG